MRHGKKRAKWAAVTLTGWLALVAALSAAPMNHIRQFNELSSTASRLPDLEQATAWTKVAEAATRADDPYYAYFSLVKAGHAHLSGRRNEAAAECFETALNHPFTTDGAVLSRFQKDQTSIILTLFHLRTAYVHSAKLALAEATQSRAERAINSWVESLSGEPFDCLTGEEIHTLPKNDQFLLWRICTTRAELLDMQGRTIEAVALLEKSLGRGDLKTSSRTSRDEYFRTQTNLAIFQAFLGYKARALELHRSVEDTANPRISGERRAAGFATLNRLVVQMKSEGYTRTGVDGVIAAVNQIASTNRDRKVNTRFKELIAKSEARLGETERAEELYRQIEGELSKSDNDFLKMYTRRGRLIEIGNQDADRSEAEFIALLISFRDRGMKRGEPTLYREYADFLASQQRLDEAVQMIARAATMTERFGWDLHLPQLWIRQAQWHDALGQTGAADELWRKINALVARTPDMPDIRLTWITEARIERSLAQRKQILAASQLASAAGKLSSLILSSHQLRTHRAYLSMLVEELRDTNAKRAERSQPAPPAVDLQPIAARSAVSGPYPARTRFSLSNVTAAPAAGRLVARGPVVSSSWNEELLVWKISAGAGAASEIKTPPTHCPAGQRLLIEIESSNDSGEFEFSWLPDTTDNTTQPPRTWKWSTSVDGAEVSHMTTAHLAKRNPFYLVPLYQELHGPAGTQNFRIIASAPCRLEISDTEGNPIATDANGDGSFTGSGDTLENDTDADLIPDVILTEAARSAGIEVAVFADERSGTDPIRLKFQLRGADGKWESVAESMIE